MRLAILTGRECLEMFDVWEKDFGGFKSPSMFQAFLGNAKVACTMLEGWLKDLKVLKRVSSVLQGCFSVLTGGLKGVCRCSKGV